MKYVGFLRGINVGGKAIVKMEELRKTLESLKFTHVKTLLNSGNVIFETDKTSSDILKNNIEEALEKSFDRKIHVIVRTHGQMKELVDSNPFNKITVTPETRLYITFLSEKPKKELKTTYESPEKDFNIIKVSDTEICSVLILSEKRNTTDSMNILEKKFGKQVTTRNWNTVKKIGMI